MRRATRSSQIFFLSLMVFLLGAACSQPVQPAANPTLPIPTSPPTLAGEAVPTRSPSPSPLASPTPARTIWMAPYLPVALRQGLNLPQGWAIVPRQEGATVRLKVGNGQANSHWIYALVAPFSTIADEVNFEDVLGAWRGVQHGPFAGRPLLMDEETRQVFTDLWNEPALGAIQVLPADNLLDAAWANQPAWAIVPFEALQPRWKVLEVDGQSPLRKEFDPDSYPLVVPLSLSGDPSLVGPDSPLAKAIPETNRDPNKLTTLVMTGVTALVRGTSNLMYANGALYPDQDIRDLLRDADITHISNEVPFDKTCPKYSVADTDLHFCTYPDYIQLLEDVGTDVVELTGDHFIDRGPEATLYTLELYKEHGWLYYGGGANIMDARQPITITHNGNQLAFIGCNAKRGGYATASETYPGAAACDFDYMHTQIRQLRDEGYLPIVTFQHQEYYTYQVKPQYRPDFTGMIDAGAVIVSGSQAHQPQNFEFYQDGFIHYGLGNLFFDQYNFLPTTNDAFIDRYVFYNGRYLGTDLLTIRFVDYARSRPMTLSERDAFLKIIFQASGW